MRYGFVIDQRKCIGCHACTVACKEENQVPLGVNRTWVKYIEKGVFPDTRRYFSVMRCNHCDNAPCVTICPTVALYRRPDGIVDFDGDRCIGCKSCMQACPYDALYIDPETKTAAKCHYCAHRVESGLEPACVWVCPVQAIVPGDLDDPHSTISRLVASQQTQVRKPEQGTRPKLYYLGAEAAALTPDMQERRGGFVFSQVGSIPSPGQPNRPPAPAIARASSSATAVTHGMDLLALARTVYDVAHPARPWGWKVAAYLWTKSIAAGAGLGAPPRGAPAARRRAGRARGAGDRARVPAPDEPAPGIRPEAPGALPLSGLQAEPALMAGAGWRHPVRGRAAWRPLAARGRDVDPAGPAAAGLAHRRSGRGHRGLQRVPLRAGRGPGFLAEPAAAAPPAGGGARGRLGGPGPRPPRARARGHSY